MNAALNITKVFISLARVDERPSYLTPKESTSLKGRFQTWELDVPYPQNASKI